MASGRERLSLRPSTASPSPFAALVTRSDTSGVWCTPEGGDPNSPLGPCRGATRVVATSSGGDTVHTHTATVERLPVKTRVVLLQLDDEPPWVLAHDREVTA